MPRINIEDDWFFDPRRALLMEKVGRNVETVAVEMWRLAQTYYRKEMLVPVDIYERMPNWQEFEACGLIERRPDGIYIKGSNDKFIWLSNKREAGKKGGLASAKQRQAQPSTTKQVLASGSLIEPSSSFSSSISKNNTYGKAEKAQVEKTQLSPEGSWIHLNENKTKAWKEAYPGINIENELSRAAAWAISNPKRKKSNWDRFLNNWLFNANDRSKKQDQTTSVMKFPGPIRWEEK